MLKLNEDIFTLIGVRADGEAILMIRKDDLAFKRINVDVLFLH